MKTVQSSFRSPPSVDDSFLDDIDDSGLRRRPSYVRTLGGGGGGGGGGGAGGGGGGGAGAGAHQADEDLPTMRSSSASVNSFPYSAGKYLVSEPIAAGGMASVHLGACNDVFEDGSTEVRVVALKRLHPHLTTDEYFTTMLLDEASISSSVRHTNVVASYGADRINGELFLVMEYVAGVPLNVILRNIHPGAVPPRYAAAITAGVLRGLHAAHEAVDAAGRSLDIVHRDVSPQNVLLGVDGVPRVFDFGIAKATRRIQTTRTGEMKGKLAYMAPEQLLSDKVDRRTDVRAAAVVLWEALTGCPLFHAESEGHTINQVLDGHTPRPSELAPDPQDLPPELDAIVMRGLEKRPEDRWSTALEMAVALEALYAASFPSARELGAWVSSIDAGGLREHQRMHADLRQRSNPPPPPPGPAGIALHTMPITSFVHVDGHGAQSFAPPPRHGNRSATPTVRKQRRSRSSSSSSSSSSSRSRDVVTTVKRRSTTLEVFVLVFLMLLAAIVGGLIARHFVPAAPTATSASVLAR